MKTGSITKEKEQKLKYIFYFSVSTLIGASLVGTWILWKGGR